MTATVFPSPAHPTKAAALALRVTRAESALSAFTSGQVDAIVDSDGIAYLLRPAQEHLRQNERRLEAVMESAADLITMVNRSGEIVLQSRAVLRMLGYEPGSLVGKALFEFVHADDLSLLYTAFFNVIDGFRPEVTIEFRHRNSSGQFRVLEATLNKLHDVSMAGVVLICRDVTLRRLTQDETNERVKELAETTLAKDCALAMLSHELRTPLMPALLGLTILQEDERLPEEQVTLAMIRRNLELQSKLLEQLTDFTAVAQQKIRLGRESVDAHEAVRFVVEMCQSEIAAAQVRVLLELRASERRVLADSLKLQQVMWNLLKNAIKFSHPGGSVTITSANEENGRLTLQFIDHGIGIAPKMLALIFDPFEQGDPALHQRYGGLGLGLFIAKGMAEAQKGTLTVASKGPGQGATFRLTLDTARSPNVATSSARVPIQVRLPDGGDV